MSIKISEFDYQYFVKNHFVLNFALGVLAFLSFITIFDLSTYFLKFLFISSCLLYFFFCIFLYRRAKAKPDALLYAQHRLLGGYLTSFSFLLVTLSVSLNVGEIYFWSYIVLYILFNILIRFEMSAMLDSKQYLNEFTKGLNKKEEVDLYGFIFLLTRYECKINGWLIFFGFILIQMVWIAVLKEILKISAPYEFYIMPGIFFFISSFTLYNIGLKMYLPYSVLKEEVQ
ncbi:MULTISPECIES: hypothetical protein [Acinetobacter]|uniref:hypothetical protein n=1 Tax=Acinetobacter TaxID=469 RepID=UPI0002D04D60|nr:MULTISPECIES: hypothetical protein [Acinetobacter]ENX60876.1 hypothetical protein F885_01984 [Acinetobacter higginsii]MCH7316718.1 hypothetical protein [Acinetobacter higginsii]